MEVWQHDAVARDMMAAITRLPAPLLPHILSYLSLYRPCKSALSWKKALRVTTELAALVATGHVLIPGQVARPCPPRIWAMALEKMLEQRDAIRRPLGGHNYLKKIAWGLADAEDAKREQQYHDVGARSAVPLQGAVEHDDGLLPIERAIKEREARLAEGRKEIPPK